MKTTKTWPSVSFTRLALVVAVPLAVVFGVNAVAWATASVKTWNEGDTLTAADLNASFAALTTTFVDLSSDQAIGGNKAFTGSIDVGGSLHVGGNVNVGVQLFNQAPNLPGACTHPQTGVHDCACPAGMTVISGGAVTNEVLVESRPISTGSWRVACRSLSTGLLVDCTGFSYICARLGA